METVVKMEAVVKKEFTLENLCCPVCAGKIQTLVGKFAGVKDAAVDFPTQKLTIEFDGEAGLSETVARAGEIVKQCEPDIEMLEASAAAPGEKRNAEISPLNWKRWLFNAGLWAGAVLFFI